MAAAAATTLLALLALAHGQVISHHIKMRLKQPKRSVSGSAKFSGSGFDQTCSQVLDRNCFSDENGTLSDTFLDRTGDEEAKVIVSEQCKSL